MCFRDRGGALRPRGARGRRRDEGVAILLVSAELDEIFGFADRIAVMYEGRIVAVLDAADATREQVGLLMPPANGPSPT